MTELLEQLQASVGRLEVRKDQTYRPREHCQSPCTWAARCRVVERHGNGAECWWHTHTPGFEGLSRIGKRITMHALKVAAGERAAIGRAADYIRERDADYFTDKRRLW